ncbi:MAG: amidase [Gemmatimonadaceae bacterium]|nr:amidase [Acetobacteraceae bacterium]
MQTLTQAAADLAAGRTTARGLVEASLDRIADPAGEGTRAFIAVYADAARTSADAMDMLRGASRAPGPYAGLPVAVKDLFDVAGEVTRAGSAVLAEAKPATTHAPVVARLLAQGFVPVGRTNMTEFAFGGIGINPHYGTPRSPWRRDVDGVGGHVPGGSSSGTAVAVADGMAIAGLGTDTGGSCRIPAAFCGIVGYKPTARRVPNDGVLPLSPTLDSVGPLANTVQCCASLDAILAGHAPRVLEPMPLRGLRLAVPGNMVMEGVDAHVAEAFGRALNRLGNLGVRITHLPFPQFERIADASTAVTFAAVEAFVWHRALMEKRGAEYDPRVLSRIERGRGMTAPDLVALQSARRAICASMDAATAPFDAVVMPTTPIVPPRIDALADDAEYARVNTLVLRNPLLANFLDRCSISIPAHRAGEAPVGFMLTGETGGDDRLFAIAAAIEPVLKE